jgi:hypothetical protein
VISRSGLKLVKVLAVYVQRRLRARWSRKTGSSVPAAASTVMTDNTVQAIRRQTDNMLIPLMRTAPNEQCIAQPTYIAGCPRVLNRRAAASAAEFAPCRRVFPTSNSKPGRVLSARWLITKGSSAERISDPALRAPVQKRAQCAAKLAERFERVRKAARL